MVVIPFYAIFIYTLNECVIDNRKKTNKNTL